MALYHSPTLYYLVVAVLVVVLVATALAALSLIAVSVPRMYSTFPQFAVPQDRMFRDVCKWTRGKWLTCRLRTGTACRNKNHILNT